MSRPAWCNSVLMVGGGPVVSVACRRLDADHESHMETTVGAGLTWTDRSPGAVRLAQGGPVNGASSDAPPARARGIRHGACSNIMCPNRAGEGQMATFVLRSRAGASRDVALILCAPCADALVRECGGS